MMIKNFNITSKGKDFDSVFAEVTTVELNLTNPNCCRIFALDIQNNKFDYIALHKMLQRNLGRYVFSRATIENFTINDDLEAIGLKAQELLRKADNPKDSGAGGELGEILLYLFLEQKLNAPKLLSKMELKTSANQYVYGGDGIHLLNAHDKLGVPICQLILGESKIIGDYNTAIDKIFVSLKNSLDDFNTEINLVETNIFKESFDNETMEYLKEQLIPSKRDLSKSLDKALGVFLGYSIDLDGSCMSNSEYRKNVQKKMISDIEKMQGYINKKIVEYSFTAYSFYFYILPLDNAMNDRRDIINKLKGL